MSPTSPTYVALTDQLNKAHHRIRQLAIRETELIAQIEALRAVIAVLSREVHVHSDIEPSSTPLQTSL